MTHFLNVLFLFRRSKFLSHRSKLIMTSFGLNFMSLWQIFQPVSMAHFGQKFRRVLTKQMTTFGQKLWRNLAKNFDATNKIETVLQSEIDLDLTIRRSDDLDPSIRLSIRWSDDLDPSIRLWIRWSNDLDPLIRFWIPSIRRSDFRSDDLDPSIRWSRSVDPMIRLALPLV
jgi:hypothetical protein